jgi:hypothetical protein
MSPFEQRQRPLIARQRFSVDARRRDLIGSQAHFFRRRHAPTPPKDAA